MARAGFTPLPFAVLAAFLLGCGGQPPVSTPNPVPTSSCTPSATPEHAYSVDSGYGFTVSMYSVDSCTGAMTATAPASVATGYALPQGGAEQMVVDPLGRFAYVANLVSNASDLATISMFTIDPKTGVLNPTTPATVPTGFFPQGIAIDPTGRFVYTANSDDNAVSMFTVDQTTGILTPTNPPEVSTIAQVSTGLDSSPVAVIVDPTGKFAYVTNEDQSTISMFNINQTTGVLSPSSTTYVFTGPSPFMLALSPNGKWAYAPNNDSGGIMTYGVSQFTIDPVSGVLSKNAQPAVAAGNAPTAAVVDPTSHFAYVVNRNDNDVSMYTIDQTSGTLTPNGTVAAGGQPFRILFDPSGKFLYVVNEAGPASVFTVQSDGALAPAPTASTGASSLSIAITPGS